VRLRGVPRVIAGCAFSTVCLAPFLFGAVERSVWIPLCQFWMGAGLVSVLCRAPEHGHKDSPGFVASRALLPLHALFLLQLIPLPAAALRVISPGSFAAHFLPDPGDGRFRPISVSPSASVEAWLYVAGLQGLFLALQGFSERTRRSLALVLVLVLVGLAGEGFWQSRTAHPSWLYGRIPIQAPIGLDTATFGPYFNRNHFATAMALGAAWACGLALALVRERGAAGVLSDSAASIRAVLLAGSTFLFTLAAAASGSRSGVGAALIALAALLTGAFGRRFLAAIAAGATILVFSGAAAIERLAHLDLDQSRWAPWSDMTRLWRFFPAFGSGIGTFGETYWPYQLNAAFEFWQHAHNDYLEWTIEAGIAGLIVAALGGRAFWRSIAFDDWARYAATGSLVAVGLQALLDFPIRIPANAALLVCSIALFVRPNPRSPTQSR
jgi:putative inorganic carbon (HCO3(-)) transporter